MIGQNNRAAYIEAANRFVGDMGMTLVTPQPKAAAPLRPPPIKPLVKRCIGPGCQRQISKNRMLCKACRDFLTQQLAEEDAARQRLTRELTENNAALEAMKQANELVPAGSAGEPASSSPESAG